MPVVMLNLTVVAQSVRPPSANGRSVSVPGSDSVVCLFATASITALRLVQLPVRRVSVAIFSELKWQECYDDHSPLSVPTARRELCSLRAVSLMVRDSYIYPILCIIKSLSH
jgi:hypothetical protein